MVSITWDESLLPVQFWPNTFSRSCGQLSSLGNGHTRTTIYNFLIECKLYIWMFTARRNTSVLHYSLTIEMALLGPFSSSLHFIHIQSSNQNIFNWNMFRPSIARDTISQLSLKDWVIYCLSRPSINTIRAIHLIQLRLAAISSRLASRRGAMFGRFTCRHRN
jgi:hypothetical protein